MVSGVKEERVIITELARKNKSIYASISRKDINIARGIKSLIGKGIIIKENNHYILTDPVFELWIQRNVL